MSDILITGGTGTFGRAFVARLLAIPEVKRIGIYSRGEHQQAEMRRDFADNPRLRWFIGDVRDKDRLRFAMSSFEAVLHAAALKRVEVGEYNPGEMVKTNVIGALNVVEAALDADVERVVALSSDKACEPLNAYGKSKALAENIFLAGNAFGGNTTMFSVVRYGNIAGSRGSVIPTWRSSGPPVRMTDPNCTRFWMRIDQACEMVETVLNEMAGGELWVPQLRAYRLGDLAVAMGLRWDEPAGLGPGEKRHEVMIGAHEFEHFWPRVGYWIRDGAPGGFMDRPLSSDNVSLMTIGELQDELERIPWDPSK